MKRFIGREVLIEIASHGGYGAMGETTVKGKVFEVDENSMLLYIIDISRSGTIIFRKKELIDKKVLVPIKNINYIIEL